MKFARSTGRALASAPMLLVGASCVPTAGLNMAATAPALAQPAGAIRLTETPEWAKLEPGMPYRIIEPEIAPVQPFAPAAEQDEGSRARSLECLARTIYYEARSETEDGQRAVAQVVLNRVRHPAYPASVCGVVNQGAHLRTGCQFTFNCDGSLRLAPHGYAWDRARKIAAEALSGVVYGPVGTATHYHTTAILPYWAKSLTRSAVVGAHVFYRWRGRQGAASAFTQRYAGQEPGAGIQLGPISEVPPIALASASTVEAGVRKWSGMPDVRIHRGKAPKEAPTEENLALAASTAEAQPASFGVTVHRGDSSLPTE